ncbi:hypothetical protein DRQ05_05535 [bacterium]|nr:MAG: hypothetical protein DRQ05_05535 [bacterium]
MKIRLLIALLTALTIIAVASLSTELLAASSSDTGAGMTKQCNHSYVFHFSGFFKGDLIYDQARVNSGDYALYVLEGAQDNVMNITARETRLGLDFSWKDPNSTVKTDAKLEFDFYGLGAEPAGLNTMENKAAPMLRHAYVKVTKGHWSLLAGQTSDVISPLVPKTVNYTVAWGQGNIGYRRPQLRASTFADVSDNLRVKLAVAAARTLGGDIDGNKIDDGADAAVPTFEGRLAFCGKFGSEGITEIGFSGHYGKEEFAKQKIIAAVDDSFYVSDINSWSFNVDAMIKPSSKFCLKGEFFMGQNLGTYFGGILQSVNPLDGEIGSKGGWGMLSLSPTERLTLNAGYSLDDPDDADFNIPQTGEYAQTFKDLNSVAFGNIMYAMTSNVTAMLEFSSLKTTYTYKTYHEDELSTSSKDYDDFRVQFALKAAIN